METFISKHEWSRPDLSRRALASRVMEAAAVLTLSCTALPAAAAEGGEFEVVVKHDQERPRTPIIPAPTMSAVADTMLPLNERPLVTIRIAVLATGVR